VPTFAILEGLDDTVDLRSVQQGLHPQSQLRGTPGPPQGDTGQVLRQVGAVHGDTGQILYQVGTVPFPEVLRQVGAVPGNTGLVLHSRRCWTCKFCVLQYQFSFINVLCSVCILWIRNCLFWIRIRLVFDKNPLFFQKFKKLINKLAKGR
jgi:hypothetical protein